MFSNFLNYQLSCCFYSSFTIALVAFLSRHNKSMIWLSPESTILFGTSIWYHAFGNRCVLFLDKAIVHLMALQLFWRGVILTSEFSSFHFIYKSVLLMFWLAYLYSFVVYYFLRKSHLPGTAWIPWHVSVHCVGSFGCVMLNLVSENFEKRSLNQINP